MGNSCCKLTKRSPNLKVQIDSLRLHMNLDQAMVDSNGTTLSVKGSSPKGAPTKCSAHLRLFRVDQVGYVLQLELVAEDRPKSKYGAVLPVNYVAPRWTCGIQTGFEFFSDPNDIPSRGSKFGESENCYLRYGLGTDQDGLRQGKYKFCIVEADQIHLREYEGKFKFAKGSEGNIKIETHPDAATVLRIFTSHWAFACSMHNSKISLIFPIIYGMNRVSTNTILHIVQVSLFKSV
mmetsp:Transcript_47120/g.75695  ORF Transcript_47120/g.75695 Transcript_47120/m.75695 type:complete len:235 (+) Transcript_47120:71-775(+)